MPNDTLAANAAPMPINRRAVFGALAATGALLAVPAVAGAGHPDAELFELSKKARALSAEYDALDAKCVAAMAGMERPPVPETLFYREGDKDIVQHRGESVDPIGKQLFPAAYEDAILTRDTLVKLCGVAAFNGRVVGDTGMRMMARCVEIIRDYPEYEAACDAARDAAGVTALNEEMERVHAEMLAAYRAIALRPARTVEGVLAKLASCAVRLASEWPLDPDGHDEEVYSRRVAEVAAIDYASLIGEAI